jgi:hypothetical protein
MKIFTKYIPLIFGVIPMKKAITLSFLYNVSDVNSGFVENQEANSLHHAINRTKSLLYSGAFIERKTFVEGLDALVAEEMVVECDGLYTLTTEGKLFVHTEIIACAA